MHIFHFTFATTILLSALTVAPAFAAPATAWEDHLFVSSPGTQNTASIPAGDEMFGRSDDLGYTSSLYRGAAGHYDYDQSPLNLNASASYLPNYVAPPAPLPVNYPGKEYDNYCRPYSERIRVGDEVREKYGTACLQPDGSWIALQ